MWGRGYYFSSDVDFASDFGENVRGFFLNITKPFVVDKVDAPASIIAMQLKSMGIGVDFDYRGMKAYEFVSAFGNQKFTDVLMKKGYDGVIVEDFEYVAFEQNQMKLADAITYDDNGDVIPLSERFADSTNDIRNSREDLIDTEDEIGDNKTIGGAENGSENTELLEQRTVSAVSGRYDPVWKQSESAKKILGYLGRVREVQTLDAKGFRDSESGWLKENAYQQQIDKGFADGVLRDLRGVSLSGRDIIGRKLSESQIEEFSGTIFKDENGNIIPLYHWTPNVFREFKFGDVGFHFGTAEASHERYEMLKEENESEGKITPIGIYKEVYLNITKPIFMADLGRWAARDVALWLVKVNLLSERQYDRLSMTEGFYDLSYDNPAINEVRKFITNLGYDGIIYYNQSEDLGSVSAIALFPEQVIMVTDNGVRVDTSGESTRKRYSYADEDVDLWGLLEPEEETADSTQRSELLDGFIQTAGVLLEKTRGTELNEGRVRRIANSVINRFTGKVV